MDSIDRPWAECDAALTACRSAASGWARQTLASRLSIVRRARRLIARRATRVAATIPGRAVRDTLVCEVLPLLDAMRFLERRAKGVLATKTLRRGRPLWMIGLTAQVERVPLGVVLILGPGNFPLFLPCVQAIQALVAGNGVCLKPAPGGEAAAAIVVEMLREAGLHPDVMRLLNPDSGAAAARCEFDRIFLTGSAATGIEVLKAAAPQLTPATMELSGCDAAFVLAGADVDRVARCLAYGLQLNAGATCIAPRRVFVLDSVAKNLEASLLALLPAMPPGHVPPGIAARLDVLLDQAVRSGARILRSHPQGPVIILDARCDLELLRSDLFAPWLAIVAVADMDAALMQNRCSPYALGASIFGPPKEAKRLARRVTAGSVCINDLIVPTADPRLPFGGSNRSGFGRTRGAEGLLEMSMTRSISVRRGRFLPHLRAVHPKDAVRFARVISLLHGHS